MSEDAPHQPRRHREEVCPVLPFHSLDVDQPQVRLVDERSGLKTVTGSLTPHMGSGNPVQLVVHERNQLVQGHLVALSRPDVDGCPVDGPGQDAGDAVDRLFVIVVAVRRSR